MNLRESGIPDDVKKFIDENIFSVSQLEVLLLLYRNRERVWTAEEVGEELRSSQIAATQQLHGLYSRQLLSKKSELGSDFYVFSGVLNEREKIVDKLSQCYSTYRVSIITLIYERKTDALRSFSEAFVIKKGK